MSDLVGNPKDRFSHMAHVVNYCGPVKFFFMPPTSTKLRGHIGLGLSV